MSTITNGSWKIPAALFGLLLASFVLMVLVGTAEKMTEDALFKSQLELATAACAKEKATTLVTFAVPKLGERSPKKQISCAVK